MTEQIKTLPTDPPDPIAGEGKDSLRHVERVHVLKVFNREHRNVSETARKLGIHRRSLQRKLARIGRDLTRAGGLVADGQGSKD